VPVRFDAEAPDVVPSSGPSLGQLVRRTLYLVYIFLPVVLTAFFAMLSGSFREPYWYRMITCAVSKAGAAFIKYGQWASTRPDIFPVRDGCVRHMPHCLSFLVSPWTCRLYATIAT
jgi:hypothetical protein